MSERIRIDYYLSHPIQYFSPLFRKLSTEADLQVYYYSDASVKGEIDKEFGTIVKWDLPLLQGYRHEFLRNWSGSRSMSGKFTDAFNPSIFNRIRKSDAQIIIINGWNFASNWLVMLYGKLFGKKVWLRAESPLNQEKRKSGKTIFLKKILLGKLLFPMFVNKCLYIGKESKAFFEFYGVSPRKLLYTPYAVDNEYFQHSFSEKTKEEIRAELGLPRQKNTIVFSGKFIEKKRPLDLLKAFSLIDHQEYCLVMVGEGELRAEMESFIRERQLKNVFLTGFVNQTLIPAYYKSADLFVMSSGMGETWGLSVNEAMNAAIPVIVSKTCGSSKDLVEEVLNGFTYEEGDSKELANKIEQVFSNQNNRELMGKRSLEIVEKYSIDIIVENIINSATDARN